MCKKHKDVCEMLSLEMCECIHPSMPSSHFTLPREEFCKCPVLGSRMVLFAKGWWARRSHRRKYAPIISANLGMPPLCSVLPHTYVSYKKHIITVSSVTSPEGCTLCGRSGLHEKATFAMCFQHLNPERYTCFPSNCIFGGSR